MNRVDNDRLAAFITPKGHHKIHECWFSGLVVPIHSVLTVVILPIKNVLGL